MPCTQDANASARAVWRFAPKAAIDRKTLGMVMCLEPHVLDQATVSAYANGTFIWTISRDPYESPNCLHIPGLEATTGQIYETTVSDRVCTDSCKTKTVPSVASHLKLQLAYFMNQQYMSANHRCALAHCPPKRYPCSKSCAFEKMKVDLLRLLQVTLKLGSTRVANLAYSGYTG